MNKNLIISPVFTEAKEYSESWADDYNFSLCNSGLKEVFGTVPNKFMIVASGRPIKKSKAIYFNSLGYNTIYWGKSKEAARLFGTGQNKIRELLKLQYNQQKRFYLKIVRVKH